MMAEDDPLIYPIALKDGRVAKLQLPRNISKDEAEKIARVVIALATDQP
jgi:hypothetical protein